MDGALGTGLLATSSDAMSSATRVPNGIGLLDPAAQKLYLPATTGEGADTAVCGPSIPTSVQKGDVYTFSCVFAGVPTELSTVTVRQETFGSFPNVPVR